MKMYYAKPASNWHEALPLGNGRIGAMVFGGTKTEKIAFNEDTLWTGYPEKTQKNISKNISILRGKKLSLIWKNIH